MISVSLNKQKYCKPCQTGQMEKFNSSKGHFFRDILFQAIFRKTYILPPPPPHAITQCISLPLTLVFKQSTPNFPEDIILSLQHSLFSHLPVQICRLSGYGQSSIQM